MARISSGLLSLWGMVASEWPVMEEYRKGQELRTEEDSGLLEATVGPSSSGSHGSWEEPRSPHYHQRSHSAFWRGQQYPCFILCAPHSQP